jgi:hypothetical protein
MFGRWPRIGRALAGSPGRLRQAPGAGAVRPGEARSQPQYSRRGDRRRRACDSCPPFRRDTDMRRSSPRFPVPCLGRPQQDVCRLPSLPIFGARWAPLLPHDTVASVMRMPEKGQANSPLRLWSTASRRPVGRLPGACGSRLWRSEMAMPVGFQFEASMPHHAPSAFPLHARVKNQLPR